MIKQHQAFFLPYCKYALHVRQATWILIIFPTLFAFLISCSSTAPFPPFNSGLHYPPHDSESSLQLAAQSNITLAKWYLAEHSYYQQQINTPSKAKPPVSWINSIKLKIIVSKQKRLSNALFENCKALQPEKHFFLLSQCTNVLSALPLKPEYNQALANMQQSLTTIESELTNSIKAIQNHHQINLNKTQSQPSIGQNLSSKQVNSILKTLNNVIQSGDLLTAKVVFQTLSEHNSLTEDQQIQLQKLNKIFINKTQTLDQYADQLYQKKSIDQALAIWTLLLKLNPSPDILNKHNRAQKVLENLRELRQDGHTVSTDTPQELK